ncbi:RidA family protein [Mesobaculum littorinae]|uniref:RidA family protein n=1 Tax=Mesobaculum littorinae TaxID=2486419 RepID=A0A438AKU9_9RHOB|nr:Rid family hydrolase [Mesobaculum littorinae]RVV99235.1 RidA family protein [Mesobaculum littorinae]
MSDDILRLSPSARASLATVAGGNGYFAVTPDAPYDPDLGAADQARQLLAKAEARLRAIGSARDRLLFVAILLRDIGDVAEVNAVWDEWLDGVAPPARACFEAALASPAMKVEMVMIARATGAPAKDAPAA